MKPISAVIVLCTLGVPVLPAVADLPDPRTPLTFQDAGLYRGFTSDATSAFSFHIEPFVAYEDGDYSQFNSNLLVARQDGKRVIVDLLPQARDAGGNYYGITELDAGSSEASLDKLVHVVDQFFNQVSADDLYGITIGEEHIFWNGQADLLNSMYDKVKANHDVPVFQWYSPSSVGTAPGISGWYNLRSDGWVSDEYHLDAEAMERNMRAYTVMQKPHVNVIWAGGDALSGSVPFIQERFDAQLAVHEKYDIPAAYFTWSGVGGTYGWSDDAPQETKDKFAQVLAAAAHAANSGPVDYAAWDNVPWEIPVIALESSSPGARTASYGEDYAQDRVIRFVNDAAIAGFAHLRWDSSAVELRPRAAGEATATVAYSFESPETLAFLNVNATGFAASGGADVTLAVFDSEGNLLGTSGLTPGGALNLDLSGARFSGRRFQVVYSMTGVAAAAGDVLAGVEAIHVDALMGDRPFYAFRRNFEMDAPEERTAWSVTKNTDTGSQGPQYNASTTHYDATTNTHEPFASSEVRIEPVDATTNGTGEITLIRRFDAPEGETFARLVFEADAHGYSSWGSGVQLAMSKDGVHWDVTSQTATAGFEDQHLVADSIGVEGYEELSTVWLKVYLYDLYGFGDPTTQYVHAWNMTLSGVTTAEPVPEPSVLSMLGLGVMSLWISGRRRRAAR